MTGEDYSSDCGMSLQDVPHLFNCTAHLIDLITESIRHARQDDTGTGPGRTDEDGQKRYKTTFQ